MAERVGRAGQARIERSNGHFDVVQEGVRGLVAVEVHAGHLANGLVHRLVVVRGRHDEVAPLHEVVVPDLVVMNQRPARGLEDADPRALPRAARGELVAEELGVGEQSLDDLGRVEQLDEPRPVERERRVHHGGAELRQKGLSRFFRELRGDDVAVLDACERSYLVPPVIRAEVGEVGELHVAPRADRLAELLAVALLGDPVEAHGPVGVSCS